MSSRKIELEGVPSKHKVKEIIAKVEPVSPQGIPVFRQGEVFEAILDVWGVKTDLNLVLDKITYKPSTSYYVMPQYGDSSYNVELTFTGVAVKKDKITQPKVPPPIVYDRSTFVKIAATIDQRDQRNQKALTEIFQQPTPKKMTAKTSRNARKKRKRKQQKRASPMS